MIIQSFGAKSQQYTDDMQHNFPVTSESGHAVHDLDDCLGAVVELMKANKLC